MQAAGHFQLNPPARNATLASNAVATAGWHSVAGGPGRSSLREFLRRSLGQYRNGYPHFARFLKFAQTPCDDWQAIPVIQH
jgi:hypothetical protein